jgi:F0F1-type ATP synthase assembly protein I
LAARSRRGNNASEKRKKERKERKITGIIITASFIASSSTIIKTGFILEAFIGLSLRGTIIF